MLSAGCNPHARASTSVFGSRSNVSNQSKVEIQISEQIAALRAETDEAPGNWGAKRKLASAIRELMDCLCATDAPEDELLAIAHQVEESARRFSDQPRMINPPGVAEGSLVGGMEIFMDRSPVKGLSNPIAPPADLTPDHDAQLVHGSVTFGNAYEGAPGCAHGGWVAAVFDEALGMACIFSGGPAMTGEITIRYRKPTPTKVPLRIEARFDRQERRKIHTSGEMYAGDQLIATSHGIFIAIDFEKFERLREEKLRREQSR
jgi:acyl-coenzyme A thioesterase PaaI-like protein